MGSNTAPVRVDRILLHIGTEKTGTSSIQHFLSKNRATLAAEGVVYPQFTGPNGGSQWGVVAAVQKRPWVTDIGARLGIRDEAGAETYRQQLLNSIDNELLACPGRHTLILSSEHFHSRLRGVNRLRALKSLLSRWSDNVQIIVYFRRQDRVAISHYSTKLKSGQADPAVFPVVVGDSLPYYYDYERIYNNWSEVFGEKAIQAGIFAPQHLNGGDLLTDFCDRAGIAEAGKIRPAKINQSLSETGVQLLLELNRQWPKIRRSNVSPSREMLVASIAREHPGRSFPATRAQAQAFYTLFTAGNARLARDVFPALKGPLFDEDFSDYPEELVPMQENVSEQVRRHIRAWRTASLAEKTIGVGRWLLPVIQLLGSAALKVKLLATRVGHLLSRIRHITTSSDLPPVFLHMGLPKTATTTLQNTLFSQHPDICYLGKRGEWKTEKGCASAEIDKALQPILWQRWKLTDTPFVRSVIQEHSLTMGPEKPILGSWEGLLIKPPSDFEAMLREAQKVLGDVRVIATLRNPLKRIPSAYLHALKSCAKLGKHHTLPSGRFYIPFDEWLSGAHQLVKLHDYRFDFGHNLRFATEFLGRDKVGVFLMEDMIEDRQAFFASILQFLGVHNVNAELIENKHLNKALTNAQIDFLKSLDTSVEQRKQWLALSKNKRRSQLDAITETGKNDKCKIVLTEAQRQLIEDRSRDLDHWLMDTFGLDLERHGYPL